jgi:MFS family permease
MFSIAIPALITAFALDKAQAGSISSITLITSAIGGWVAGALSDRYGRVRVLQLTILWFSLFTFLGAFAQSYGQLLFLKGLQGLGFGGEWAAGAVLMAETIRPEHRGKVMGTVQSAWAWGWGGSVVLYTVLFSWLPAALAWRVMFGLGLLPALLVIYVQRSVPESKVFAAKQQAGVAVPNELFAIFSPAVLRMTVVGCLLGVGAHGGYYALMTWLPTFLKTERHLSVLGTGAYLAVIIVAFGAAALSARSCSTGLGGGGISCFFGVLRGDRALLRLSSAHQSANAGAGLSARIFRSGHPRQPRGVVQ